MAEPLTALWLTCDAYQAMQQVHLECLEATPAPDLVQLGFERDQHFADLQNSLTVLLTYWQHKAPAPECVQALQQRLKMLQVQDGVLAVCLQTYRTALEHHRAQLQQGQKLLHSYSGRPPLARHVSSIGLAKPSCRLPVRIDNTRRTIRVTMFPISIREEGKGTGGRVALTYEHRCVRAGEPCSRKTL